ncbi:MAG: LpxD N-terminal domain-containing protein, partial [Planctomycetota bacterium]|nr:LpxD N-terminal domain-containing protein [Planctomycetota bacterium]
MKVSLYTLARLVNGEVSGAGDTDIHAAATIRDVQEGEITFAQDDRLLQQVSQSAAAAVVIGMGMETPSIPAIRVVDVTAAFAQIVEHFVPVREVT